MISKKIILPLIIVIILAGIGGVLAAQKRIQWQLEESRKAAEESETKPSADELMQAQ